MSGSKDTEPKQEPRARPTIDPKSPCEQSRHKQIHKAVWPGGARRSTMSAFTRIIGAGSPSIVGTARVIHVAQDDQPSGFDVTSRMARCGSDS